MAMPVVDRDLEARPLERIHVRVVNRNDFPITDRYDGVVYKFEPADQSSAEARGPDKKEHSVTIPAEAANHIFGWTPTATHDEMFMHFQRRSGWNTPAYADGKGERFFKRIEITSVTYRLVEVATHELVDEDEALDAVSAPKEAHPRAPVRRGA